MPTADLPGVKLDLDHAAIAAHDATPVLEQLVGRLGATVLYGALDVGFRWVLLHAGDEHAGMMIELLEPWNADEAPFLARFLERRGEGAHHLTFKTSDLRSTISAVERSGRQLVDQRLENPEWRDAFLRPRDAHGTIVQLVQTTIARPALTEMLTTAREMGPGALSAFAGGAGTQVADVWWRAPPQRAEPKALRCVVFAAQDPELAAGFYENLLGGERLTSTRPGRIELAWHSGGHVAFEQSVDGKDRLAAFDFEPAAIELFTIGRTAITFGSSSR